MISRFIAPNLEPTVKSSTLMRMLTTALLILSTYPAASAEFEARAKFWPTIEVLRQATSYGAELIGMANSRLPYQDGPLGVIEEGAYADLLIIDGNPLDDISLLANPEKNMLLIMKDGEIIKFNDAVF
jgi:imidazolonepropionase-like amidohydrolase